MRPCLQFGAYQSVISMTALTDVLAPCVCVGVCVCVWWSTIGISRHTSVIRGPGARKTVAARLRADGRLTNVQEDGVIAVYLPAAADVVCASA